MLSAADKCAQVADRFAAEASFWDAIYQREDVFSIIHQERARRALAWVDALVLDRGSRVLEVGCGAGQVAIALAHRGLRVAAIDRAGAMLRLARSRAAAAGLEDGLGLGLGDAHALGFPDGAFRAVVALGLIPWLASAPDALSEMHRVLAPGGYLIVSGDNRARLVGMLDPLFQPMVWARQTLRCPAPGGAQAATYHWPGEFDGLLAAVGFEKVCSATCGFGPFTLLGRPVLPRAISNRLNALLQEVADRGTGGLSWTGTQYLVLARK